MEVEKLIDDLVVSYKRDISILMLDMQCKEYMVLGFSQYLKRLLHGVETIRKQDLSNILNSHFISGKELNREELLKDLLNVLG
jgi:hypothetical protein